MKKLKIALSLLFALTFSLFLVACGGGKEVTEIQLEGQKTSFVEGEAFSTGDLTVTVYYRGSDEPVVLEADQYEVDSSAYNPNQAGEYSIVITPEQEPAEGAQPVTMTYLVTVEHNWQDNGDGTFSCDCGASRTSLTGLTDTVTTVAWGNQATLTEKSENSPATAPRAGENHVSYGVLVAGQSMELTLKILEVDTGATWNTPLMGVRNGAVGILPREDNYVIGTVAGFTTPDGGTKDAAVAGIGTATAESGEWVVYSSGSNWTAADLVGGTDVIFYNYGMDGIMTIRHTLTKADNSTMTLTYTFAVPDASYEIVAYGEKVTYQVTAIESVQNRYVTDFTAELPTATEQAEGKMFDTTGIQATAEMSAGDPVLNSYNAYAYVDVANEDGTTTQTRVNLASEPLTAEMYAFNLEFAGKTYFFTSDNTIDGEDLITVVPSEFTTAAGAAVVANGYTFDAPDATFDYAVNAAGDGIDVVGAGKAAVLTADQKTALDTEASNFVSLKLGNLSADFDAVEISEGYASLANGVISVVLPVTDSTTTVTLTLKKGDATVQTVSIDVSDVEKAPEVSVYVAGSTFTLDAGGTYTVVYTGIPASADDYTLVTGGMRSTVADVKAAITADGKYTALSNQLYITSVEEGEEGLTVVYEIAKPNLANLSATNASRLVGIRNADGETLAEVTLHYNMVFSDAPEQGGNVAKVSDDVYVYVARDKMFVMKAFSAEDVEGKLEYADLTFDVTLNIQNGTAQSYDLSVSSAYDATNATSVVSAVASNDITSDISTKGKLVALGNVGDASDYDYGALLVLELSVTTIGLREEDVAQTYYFTANEDTVNGQDVYTVFTVTGDEITSTEVTPAGERVEQQAWSCVSDGIEAYVDETTGFKYGALITPASGAHEFGEYVDNKSTCSVCGATSTRVEIDENSYYQIILLSAASADVVPNTDTTGTWWDSSAMGQRTVSGDFAVQYTWTNTRDVNWYQDVVLELTDGEAYFDMNFFMSATAWGSPALWTASETATRTTTTTYNGEAATLPDQGGSDSFEGDYTATFVRLGSTLTITQTIVLTDGNVWEVVDVFTEFPTGELTVQLTGNPYWVDDIRVTVGDVQKIIDLAGDVNNKTVGAIASAVTTGVSVSATITNHSGDWGTQVIKTASGTIVALPNLDPWNSTAWTGAGYPQCNAFPGSNADFNDLVGEGASWDCFFNATTPYYLTVSVSVEDGVKYYRDGELMIYYQANREIASGVYVSDFCEVILGEIADGGFTFMAATGAGAVTTDLHVGAAVTDTEALALYQATQE